LAELFSQQYLGESTGLLKVLVTSRPYYSIECQFIRLQRIRLRGKDCTDQTQGDIELLIQQDLEELKAASRIPNSVFRELKTPIIAGADRTFLWASLVLKMLKETAESSPIEFQHILDHVPKDLNAIYDKILRRISRPGGSIRVFQAMLAASEPLNLEEISVMLSIQENHRSFKDLAPHFTNSTKTTKRTIKEHCGHFVKVIDSKVLFIHQTAREFLLHLPDDETSSFNWKYKLQLEEGHLFLVTACIRYLLLSEFREELDHETDDDIEDEIADEIVGEHEDDVSVLDEEYETSSSDSSGDILSMKDANNEADEEALDPFCFHHYAALHWATHFREAEPLVDSKLMHSSLILCDTLGHFFYPWFEVFWLEMKRSPPAPRDFTKIQIRSFLCHVKAAELLLDQGAEINSSDDINRTALQHATPEEYLLVIRSLLVRGASVEATEEFGPTPLHIALGKPSRRLNSEEIATLLIPHR
jgi:hypothetical protein